jgi:hypothetical protein
MPQSGGSELVSPLALKQLAPGIKEPADPFASVEATAKPGPNQETRFGCSHSELGVELYGDSATSAKNETLRQLGLCGLGFQVSDQENAPPQKREESAPATQSSPRHIFWVVPAFHVAYLKNFKPLTPREKFNEWAQGTYDPRGLGLYALESATLEYSHSDGFCGYGKEGDDYWACFGSIELDANISSFFGDFLFPVVMHQDPRYYRLGQGSFGTRLFYAVSRVFITHSDSGRWVLNSSALSGTVLAAAASNLYFPASDRGFGPSLSRAGIDLGDTALFNVAAEFWPDIKHKLHHIF